MMRCNEIFSKWTSSAQAAPSLIYQMIFTLNNLLYRETYWVFGQGIARCRISITQYQREWATTLLNFCEHQLPDTTIYFEPQTHNGYYSHIQGIENLWNIFPHLSVFAFKITEADVSYQFKQARSKSNLRRMVCFFFSCNNCCLLGIR